MKLALGAVFLAAVAADTIDGIVVNATLGHPCMLVGNTCRGDCIRPGGDRGQCVGNPRGGGPCSCAGDLADVPSTMTAFVASGEPCSAPDWPCLSLMSNVPVPKPGPGMALVQMHGASVNPLNVDLVEPVCKYLPASGPFHCSNGTFGNDGAGTVVAVGAGCNAKEGDDVYGFFAGSYAQYSLTYCAIIAKKPQTLDWVDAGSLPVAALTSMQGWKAMGAPWSDRQNLTMVVTGGQGGTGVFAIQLAKAFAPHARVVTAATGEGIALVKKLGADVVVDYHKQELFAALADDSVDLVFDNIGLPGTADKAMHAIKVGGVYAVLSGGGQGKISDHPKDGVKQIAYGGVKPNTADLEQLAKFVDAGSVLPSTFAKYPLADIPAAFTRELGHGVYGKIAINIAASSAQASPSLVV